MSIITGGSDPVSIPSGDIEFYDQFSPPLLAGAYSLTATQSVQGVQDLTADGQDPSYTQTQALRVNGPRFSLNSRDIFAQYPPANHQGNFADHLPHLVLSDRSFPWSRGVVDLSATPHPSPAPPPGTPWMALLTFYSADVQTPGDPDHPNPDGPVSPPSTVGVPQVVAANSALLTPQIHPTAAENAQQAVVIDVAYSFFKAIAPAQSELIYLAHGRQVNTVGKALAGEQAKGFFSSVVGNRVVQSGDTQFAVLVSLEGHWARLPEGADANKSANDRLKIRLVVLASWSFQASASPGDFLGLMNALNAPGSDGIDFLRLPASGTAGTPDTDPAAQALEALSLGFVPLPHDLRDGEQTTSYYRGPCAAVPCATDEISGPYHCSDSAIHYDPTFGTLNLSYAAAFQIGRLLALSDGSFASELIRWRNDYYTRWQAAHRQHSVQSPLARTIAAALPADAPAAEVYGAAHESLSSVRRLLHGLIARPLLNGQAKIPQVQPRHARQESGDRPGVLSAGEIEAAQVSGEDPLAALKNKLASLPGHNPPSA